MFRNGAHVPLYHCCNSFLSKWVDLWSSLSCSCESFDCLEGAISPYSSDLTTCATRFPMSALLDVRRTPRMNESSESRDLRDLAELLERELWGDDGVRGGRRRTDIWSADFCGLIRFLEFFLKFSVPKTSSIGFIPAFWPRYWYSVMLLSPKLGSGMPSRVQ